MQSSRSSNSLNDNRRRSWTSFTNLPLKGRDHLKRARQLLIHRHHSYTGSRITADRVFSVQALAGGLEMRAASDPKAQSEITAAVPYPPSSPDRKASFIESDDGSGSGSHRSLTPLPSNTNTYSFNQNMISSNDTLRLVSSPQSSSLPVSPEFLPALEQRSSDEDIFQESAEINENDIDPALIGGVAILAAKGTGETISAKRAIIASMTSPQQGWEILQGKRDDQVEEQVGVLELEMNKSQESASASDISRTPSQSTTGTEKSASGSFGTAASSLQSATSSDTGLHENYLPVVLTEDSNSPKLYITACSSNEDLLHQQRRDETTLLRRYHALLELVETEAGYADDLYSLVHVFFRNLTSQAFFDESEPRLKAVCRNASDLFELHTFLARRLNKIIEVSQISQESIGTDMEKALRCEEAIIQVAQQLTAVAPRFDHYQLFCSRHAEALLLIREAEKRHSGDDFAAFERMCGNEIRGNTKPIGTPSRRSSAGSSTPLGVGSVSSITAAEEEALTLPGSGTTTPSGSFASISRRSSGRLLFADYLIKPIQRLCLYPLVLNSLHKYTSEDQKVTRKALDAAISAMRKIADNVDKASKQREVDLMSDLLIAKIEPHQGLSLPFLKTLGNSSLSGTLDVLYHHDIICPLTPPLRFHRMGLILWNGFLLIVRVRKNQQLHCKYWLPLVSAELTPLEDGNTSPGTEIASWATSTQTSKPLVPFAMRLSFSGHHFELSASNDKERLIWHSQLTQAIQQAQSVLQALPCSLPVHISALHFSGSASLSNFFATNARTVSISADSLIRMSSASTRASVDRNMIFSEELLSQQGFNGISGNGGGGYGPVVWSQKDSGEALLAQQLRQNATPSIGSAVGAAMGLARIASQVPTAVKRSRRQSMLNLTEIKPTCDVLLSQSPGEFTPPSSINTSPFFPSLGKRGSFSSIRARASTPSPFESIDTIGGSSGGGSGSNSSSSKWKTNLLRKNSKAMSSRNQSGSPLASPMTSTTDLSQSIKIEAPLSPGELDSMIGILPQKPPHVRSKSSSLREVWQNSINRRSRSQSTTSPFIQMANGMESPIDCTSLTSSPVLDSKDSTDQSTRSFFSFDPAASSSVAHLRRILGSPSNLTWTKASGSRYLPGNSSPASINKGSLESIERSRTELEFPVMSSYNFKDRRKSEPNALSIEGLQSPIKDNKSKHPLRRLSRRMSLIGQSSPASSLLDLTNSSTTTLWTDHTRLKSVEEHTAEVTESAHGQNYKSNEGDTTITPKQPVLPRRRSSSLLLSQFQQE